ncbi:winged helix-turn-helix transcriptional regulator [Candidatus Bathyarchaeota archaeon]|nr:winged helix-turn-helix transcriptional regulator [Candidatus Bathyarchaeota archaeon]
MLSRNLALEDVLCSRQTIRILKVLKQLGRLNVSEIAQRIGTNYGATSTRLETLESMGILRHTELGRVRLYFFRESPRANAVISFLEVWET